MNVETILTEAFLAEARSRSLTIIQSEQENIKRRFDINAVQRAVDADIESIRRQYRSLPTKMAEEVEKRERYHRSNLRKLAQDYADLIARERITFLSESTVMETRTMLKASAAKPCDAYPC
jgi:S-methylmethionine-dependent homocysteine/selenocysteine methylase